MKLKPRRLQKKKIAIAPKKSEPEIDEVDAIDDIPKEIELNDLQRSLAMCELRLRDIDAAVETEVEKRANDIINRVAAHVYKLEDNIARRIINFFCQLPLWEVKKVVKADVSAGGFYNPYDMYNRLTRQGWKWMGEHFDEEAKERYVMFIREKDLPNRFEEYLKLYQEFEATGGDAAETLKAIKKENQKKLAAKFKAAGFDREGNPLVKPQKAKLKIKQ